MPPKPFGPALENDDPRRLAACVKACEGISTEALEAQIILRLVAACVHVRDPRVREVLEELTAEPPRPRRTDARGLHVLPGRQRKPPPD